MIVSGERIIEAWRGEGGGSDGRGEHQFVSFTSLTSHSCAYAVVSVEFTPEMSQFLESDGEATVCVQLIGELEREVVVTLLTARGGDTNPANGSIVETACFCQQLQQCNPGLICRCDASQGLCPPCAVLCNQFEVGLPENIECLCPSTVPATPVLDFQPVSVDWVFVNETMMCQSFEIFQDLTLEGNESVALNLISNDSAVNILSNAQVIILDSDRKLAEGNKHHILSYFKN